MTLIKSISGFRGTIGGRPGDTLSPIDAVKFAAAYGGWLKERFPDQLVYKVVVGRDARLSGEMIQGLVMNTLIAMGIDVLDLGLSTTPTVEVMVPHEKAQGGIILTASHNPKEWNALKLLNEKGEFINAEEGKALLALADAGTMEFSEVEKLGKISVLEDAIEEHIEMILAHPLVDAEAIARKGFKVAVDAVNSTGGIAIPKLLKALGVERVEELYCEPTGHFPHNPEPLEEHLTDIMETVKRTSSDLGIVVDPDVDRLALIDEKGRMFGEEYTLVAVADYVLENKRGGVVSNLSSSRALRDLAERKGGHYEASAVGEVNVVSKMKEINAVIGGEGNGGIIVPDLHYGRDALIGVALILTHLAKSEKTLSELKEGYPEYHMAKMKAQLDPSTDVDAILEKIKEGVTEGTVNTIDGVKIDLKDRWVHMRKSNTEPIIRIYTEAPTAEAAKELGEEYVSRILSLM